MFKIGIVGGIGSGKSTVTRRLQGLGCGVVDADRIGHEVLDYPEVIDQIRARWCIQENGTAGRPHSDAAVLLGPSGGKQSVSRPAVAELIFNSNNVDERKFLERVMHPLIERKIHDSLSRYNDDYIPAVVVDAPLLYEAGWDSICAFIIFVQCARGTRFGRYCMRRGVTDAVDFKAREAAQLPPEEKAKRADQVIENDAELDYLHRQVDWLWHNALRAKIIEHKPVNHYVFWKLGLEAANAKSA